MNWGPTLTLLLAWVEARFSQAEARRDGSKAGAHLRVPGVQHLPRLAGLVHLLHRLEGLLGVDRQHVPVQVHRPVGCVVTQLAQELQLVRVLLQGPIHYLLVVNVLHVRVEVGPAGEGLVTLRTVVLDIQVDTLSVHLHVAFLVCPVLTALELTVELALALPGLLVALPCFEELYMVSPQLSVVIKSLLTILTLEVFNPIVDNFLMLS